MRHTTWPVLALLLLGGCCLFGDDGTGNGGTDNEQERIWKKYGEHFEKMSPRERAQFEVLEADSSRDDFIRQRGIDIKVMLDTRLERGMTITQVVTKLGLALEHETDWRPGVTYDYWTYRVSDRLNVKYIIQFLNGRLEGWEVITGGE